MEHAQCGGAALCDVKENEENEKQTDQNVVAQTQARCYSFRQKRPLHKNLVKKEKKAILHEKQSGRILINRIKGYGLLTETGKRTE